MNINEKHEADGPSFILLFSLKLPFSMSQYGKSIAQYQLLMEIEVKKHCHTFVWLSLQCRGGCLIWASKRYKLAIVYPTGHVWLELEWTTRVGGGEGREVNFTPPPHPHQSPYFDRRPPLWYKFISLLSLPLPLKSKMAAIIFVKKILSTRSPKLRLLSRLVWL